MIFDGNKTSENSMITVGSASCAIFKKSTKLVTVTVSHSKKIDSSNFYQFTLSLIHLDDTPIRGIITNPTVLSG